VEAGAYRWRISRQRFTVVEGATAGGVPRLTPGGATVRLQDRELAFGPPVEHDTGDDWVELRGWVVPEAHLWYVARYQFFAARPFCRLVMTLTDRHDAVLADPEQQGSVADALGALLHGRERPRTEPWSSGPGDARWKQRRIERWRLAIGAQAGRPESVTQRNSFDGSREGEPRVEVTSVSGSAYQWRPLLDLDPSRYQLRHDVGDPRNRVTWYPMHTGTAQLEALYTGFKERYKGSLGVTYEVRDARGRIKKVFFDQAPGPRVVDLGTHDLDAESFVALAATGSGKEPQAIAGSLRVTPQGGGKPFEIPLGRRHPGVLADGPVMLAVKDFWQHHPISLFRTRDAIGWEAIERPELLGPGMSLTLESLVSIDGGEREGRALLYRPPERNLPSWLHPIDGSLAPGAIPGRYDELLRSFAETYPAVLEGQDSFGWRNWGDYQIGGSYTSDSGPVEQWANLQYDLPYGLLLAWLRTGDAGLWQHAQASVRHLMDIDLVKFQPFPVKLNGLVYRKGEMPRERSHVAAEPVVDQGFGFRSLLLYHHLTGESWARELARQHIRQLAWYGKNRLPFVRFGDRPAAWMLRGALAGAEHFPDDAAYDYRAVADALVAEILAYHRTAGRLPGGQPVWQGQLIEALALYHARTGRRDVAEVITSYTRFLLERCMRRKPDGTYEFAYSLQSREAEVPFGVKSWTNEDNYAFLWLASIAYAHALSGDRFFAERGRELFDYAVSRLGRERSPRPWTSALAFPHYFLHEFGEAVPTAR
jgi:hypothetical protein